MKDASTLMKLFGRTISDNSPVILTGMAIAGVVSTSVLSVKGAFTASSRLEGEDPRLNAWEKARLTWDCYIPAAAVAVSTVACIIGGHSIHTKRQAAIMSLYSVTDTAFKDYQLKVKETIGEKKEQTIRDEVAADKIKANPPSNDMIILTGHGDHLCYESFTGRYFKSSVEKIRKAENDVNAEVINNCYASQNDFYRALDIPGTSHGDEIGWKIGNMMELYYTSVLADDGTPCLSVNYRAEPIRDYYKNM